jgi:hypothetical protein
MAVMSKLLSSWSHYPDDNKSSDHIKRLPVNFLTSLGMIHKHKNEINYNNFLNLNTFQVDLSDFPTNFKIEKKIN